MHEEDGFLAAICQTPADDVARLVFADWLDEQDDPTCKLKADFIRLELRMSETPERSLNRIRWLNKLQKLAAQINPSWLAVVSHPKLEACRMSFQFECPKHWEKLTPTNDTNIRFCASCKRNVYHCETLQDAQAHANRGDCVALTVALVRKPGDLIQPRPLVPGQLQLTTDQIERIGRPSLLNGPFALPMYDLPPAPPVPQWSPQPEPPASDDQRPKPRHRKKRQLRHRNIQRDNWEEME
jgi:uncharacterized protein (TIGR02996 family)